MTIRNGVFWRVLSLVGVFLVAMLPQMAAAQPAELAFHFEARTFNSGLHTLADTPGATPLLVTQESVEAEGAVWLRLRFESWNLGEASYLVLTAQQDGAEQRLDAPALDRWQGTSAYFNGEAIQMKLYVAPGDEGVFFNLQDVMVGDFVPAPPPESICDGVDERVASPPPPDPNDPASAASGRLVPVGCTGWIVSNGAILTAGHCVGGNLQTLQFNVPPSNANGTVNHPGPEDQYPVESLTNIVSSNGGVGDDWGVFEALANSNGEVPIERQGAFYRMTNDSDPTPPVRITGYGVDGPSPGFGNGPRDETNQTQQTDDGVNVGETVNSASNAFWNYRADTQGGNSGSPVAIDGTDLTLGIHTHGGCSAGGGANAGTSFENDDLEAAIQAYLGPNVVYADRDHPIATEDGTVFRPFDTLLEAVNAAAANDVISLVNGSYDGETLVIDKALMFTTPTGAVVVGN